jgi:hypothetical protein
MKTVTTPARITQPTFQVPPGPFIDTTIPLLVNLDCRLPARLATETIPGFLDLRTGHFVSDRSAGKGAISYSWPARSWLPALYEDVALDGLHYAYVEGITDSPGSGSPPKSEGNIHVVNVATGSDRIVLRGATLAQVGHPIRGVWGIVSYSAEGIYVEKQAFASEGLWGLWLINPDTAAVRQILPESVGDFSLGGGAAWIGSGGYNNTTISRIDLATGAQTEWFRKPNRFVWYLGSDSSGRPLMMWQQEHLASSEIWVLTGPFQGSLLYSGPQSTMPFLPVATDSHGVWFGWLNGGNVLWLLDPDGKFVEVAAATVQPLGKCQ